MTRTTAPDPPMCPPGVTEKDIPKLKDMLVRHYKSSTMNICPHQPLPNMSGPPLKFALKPDARPSVVYTPAIIPVHWEKEVKDQLQRDVELGILERVLKKTERQAEHKVQ